MQKLLPEAIFRQSFKNPIMKVLAEPFHKLSAPGPRSNAVVGSLYKANVLYDIEREIQKKGSKSIEQKPFFRLISEPSMASSIMEFADLINEIDKRLAIYGMNRADHDGQGFSLSIDFKYSPEGEILFNPSISKFESPRGHFKKNKPQISALLIFYSIPFEIELHLNGSSEKFNFILKSRREIAATLKAAPYPYCPSIDCPKELEDLREKDNYETYLYGLAFQDFMQTAMNPNSPRYEEANEKLKLILSKNKIYYRLHPKKTSGSITNLDSGLKYKNIPSIGIICDDNDPAPYNVELKNKETRKYKSVILSD